MSFNLYFLNLGLDNIVISHAFINVVLCFELINGTRYSQKAHAFYWFNCSINKRSLTVTNW